MRRLSLTIAATLLLGDVSSAQRALPPDTAAPPPVQNAQPVPQPSSQVPRAPSPATAPTSQVPRAPSPATAGQRQPATAKPSRKAKPSPIPEQPVAQAPLRPLTPQQLPPQRPQVSYRGGLLSIVAENATLADILNTVRALTGAQMELTPRVQGERVFARLGPGQPRDVITALLNGSPFDYIILGSMTSPGAVERLILTPRSPGGAQSAAAGGAAGQMPGMMPSPAARVPPSPEVPDEDTELPDQPGEVVQPQPQPQPNEQFQQGQPVNRPLGIPGMQPNPGTQPQNPQTPPSGTAAPEQPPAGGVKTPEQLYRELQQMMERERQQQQQQQQQKQPPE